METLLIKGELFFDALLKASFQATVLVFLVFAIQRCCRGHLPPHWRHGLWFLVMARLLLPFSFESAISLFNYVPAPRWTSLHLNSEVDPTFAPRLPVSRAASRSDLQEIFAGESAPSRLHKNDPVPAVIAADSDSIPQRTNALSEARRYAGFIPLRNIATLVWVMGVIALSGCLGWNAVWWHYRLRRSAVPAGSFVTDVWQEVRGRLGFGAWVRIFETTILESPALYGLFRPILLIPAGMGEKFTRDELRLVLFHELAHWKRRDVAVNWVVAILQVAHWFNPLLWWGFSRMRADREVACDYMALKFSSAEEAKAYGPTLVKLLESIASSTRPPALLGIVEYKEEMKHRLSMILRFRKDQKLPLTLFGVVLLLAITALTDAQQRSSISSETLLRTHFQGLNAMGADTNLTVFHAVHDLPESRKVTAEAIDRSAVYLAANWSREDHALMTRQKFLVPVLTDLLERESFLEVRAGTKGKSEWSVAVRLPGARARLWEIAFRDATGQALSTAPWGNASGLESTNLIPNDHLTLARVGEWTLLAGGSKLSTNIGLYGDILKWGHPKLSGNAHWLEADLETSRFGPWAGLARKLGIGHSHWSVVTRKNALRTEATFAREGASKWIFQPWQMPTNLMHDPLIGFTALQGIAPLIAESGLFKKLQWDEAPNQLFLWAQPTSFATMFGAAPLKNPASAVLKVATEGLPLFRELLGTNLAGTMVVATNIPAITWRDLPVGTPFVRADTPGFLNFGLIPLKETGNPPPTELLEQVTSRTNLIYYDWEVTEARLKNWPGASQFSSLAASLYLDPNATAADEWVRALQTKIGGNAVTEISATGPREWTLLRRSDLGFTSTEIAFFMRWFNSSTFPRVGLETWVDPELKKAPSLRNRPSPRRTESSNGENR